MGDISGSLHFSPSFAKEEDVDFRETFPVYAKVEGILGNSY